MTRRSRDAHARLTAPRRNRRGRRAAVAAALTALGATLPGCNNDEALRAFRDAAASGLQSGLSSISDGIIDGAFAVFTLGRESGGGSTATAGTTATDTP